MSLRAHCLCGVLPYLPTAPPPRPLACVFSYPRLRELIEKKDTLIRCFQTPPLFIKCDLKVANLPALLGAKFDVILVDPPWEESARVEIVKQGCGGEIAR